MITLKKEIFQHSKLKKLTDPRTHRLSIGPHETHLYLLCYAKCFTSVHLQNLTTTFHCMLFHFAAEQHLMQHLLQHLLEHLLQHLSYYLAATCKPPRFTHHCCLAMSLPLVQDTSLLSADSMEETLRMLGCLVGNRFPRISSTRLPHQACQES